MTIGDSSPAVTATMASSSSREALLDPALPDERVALLVHGQGDQVGVAEALADRGGLGRGGLRGLGSPAATCCEQDRDQQVAPLDAVALLAFEQPLRAAEPSARADPSPRGSRG